MDAKSSCSDELKSSELALLLDILLLFCCVLSVVCYFGCAHVELLVVVEFCFSSRLFGLGLSRMFYEQARLLDATPEASDAGAWRRNGSFWLCDPCFKQVGLNKSYNLCRMSYAGLYLYLRATIFGSKRMQFCGSGFNQRSKPS